MTTNIEAVKEALFEAGGQTRVARLLVRDFFQDQDQEKMRMRVNRWPINGMHPKYVIPLEKISGKSRHELDPDIYPRESDAVV